MQITLIAGARPNFMKIAPVIRALRKAQAAGRPVNYRLIYTGRMQDPSLEPSLFNDLEMPRPNVCLQVESTNYFERLGGILIAFSRELEHHPSDMVMVVDDMTPTMACSLVAKKKGLKVAHLSAGIRTFNMEQPKELNRLIADGLSDYLFTAGMAANRNLNHSGTESTKVYFVGNLLIDTLRYNYPRFECPTELSALGIKEKSYVLLTLNRRQLLSNAAQIKALLDTLLQQVGDRPIVAPLHGYVRERLQSLGFIAPNLHYLPPQPCLKFGWCESHAALMVTDSGNVAEEATFLGIPCITLSRYAEHPETVTVGSNCLVGESSEELSAALSRWNRGEWQHGALPERWDGHTAERIVQILQPHY